MTERVEGDAVADAGLSGDNRPSRYIEERDGGELVVYRASSLNKCPRALVALARGYPPEPLPDFMLEVFAEGHRYEPAIIEKLEALQGADVEGRQEVYELDLGEMHGRQVVVRGSVDGEINSDSHRTLVEIKKVRYGGWAEFCRKKVEYVDSYPWQLSAYMLAGGFHDALFVGGRLEDGEITALSVNHYPDPPIPFKAIRDRVQQVEDLIAEGWGVPEVTCTDQYPCEFFKFHDVPDEPEEYELDDRYEDVVREFDVLDAAYRAQKAKADRLDRRRRKAADQLREMLGLDGARAAGAKKLVRGETVITRTVKTIAAHMRKETTQDYFTVKRPKKKSDSESNSNNQKDN